MDIQWIFTDWLLCIIVCCFIKLKWAISLFLAYLMLVPYWNLGLQGVGSGDNFIKLLMLVCLLMNAKRNKVKVSLSLFTPFIVYFVVSLIMIPFQDEVPFEIMLNAWRQDCMNVLFLPIVMWNVALIDPSSIQLFRNTMLFCIIISIGYGLVLTTMNGINPYTMYFLQFADAGQDYERYYEAADEGRLFGRISSVYIHPMAFALFIGLSLIYLYYIKSAINRFLLYGLFCTIVIMAVVCGVRSVLGGLAIALLYYILVKKKFTLLITICIIGCFGIFIISFVPELANYLGSMASFSKKGHVTGSSMEMRFNQLYGSIWEMAKNPLFGLGYDWTNFYLGVKGEHPICLCFESLAFVVLCNSGIIGVILWSYMILKFFAINRNMKIRGIVIVNALMVFYISYSMITGEYGFMKAFLIFYVLMVCESHMDKSRYNNCSRQLILEK